MFLLAPSGPAFPVGRQADRIGVPSKVPQLPMFPESVLQYKPRPVRRHAGEKVHSRYQLLTLVALGFQRKSLALLTRHMSLPSAPLLAHWRAKSWPTAVVRRRYEELFRSLRADTVLKG